MAPINPEIQNTKEDIKNVIQDLYQILVQVSNYDSTPRPSREALAQDILALSTSLSQVHTSASLLRDHHQQPPHLLPPTQQQKPGTDSSDGTSGSGSSTGGGDKGIPEPLVQYVENGRNPDIYTREFVELVRRMNQLARGKAHAFASFRDALAGELERQVPDLAGDVAYVLGQTGGGGWGKEGGGDGGVAAGEQQQQT